MSNFDLPRRGSAAYSALNALSNVGGFMTVDAWLRLLDWRGPKRLFLADVVGHLQRAKLVLIDAESCRVTDSGRRYLGQKVEERSEPTGAIAGPKYIPPARNLNISRHFPPRVDRAGSLDHLAIPSLMANQRVAYAPKA